MQPAPCREDCTLGIVDQGLWVALDSRRDIGRWLSSVLNPLRFPENLQDSSLMARGRYLLH